MKDISDEVVRRKQTQLTTALDPVLHLLDDAGIWIDHHFNHISVI